MDHCLVRSPTPGQRLLKVAAVRSILVAAAAGQPAPHQELRVRVRAGEPSFHNASLQSNNAALQSNNAALQSNNAALQSNNASLRSNNASLQSNNAALQSNNAALQSNNASLQSNNASLQSNSACGGRARGPAQGAAHRRAGDAPPVPRCQCAEMRRLTGPARRCRS